VKFSECQHQKDIPARRPTWRNRPDKTRSTILRCREGLSACAHRLLLIIRGQAGSQDGKTSLEKVLTSEGIVINQPGYQITGLERVGGVVRIGVRYIGPVIYPHCQGSRVIRARGATNG